MQNHPSSLQPQPALTPSQKSLKNQKGLADNQYYGSNVISQNQISRTGSQREEFKNQTNQNPPNIQGQHSQKPIVKSKPKPKESFVQKIISCFCCETNNLAGPEMQLLSSDQLLSRQNQQIQQGQAQIYTQAEGNIEQTDLSNNTLIEQNSSKIQQVQPEGEHIQESIYQNTNLLKIDDSNLDEQPEQEQFESDDNLSQHICDQFQEKLNDLSSVSPYKFNFPELIESSQSHNIFSGLITTSQKSQYNSAKTQKQYKWTQIEDQLLLKAYKQYKGNWLAIAQIVNSDKSPDQCKTRIHKINVPQNLLPVRNSVSTGWNDKLDVQLIKLHGKFGSQWSLLQKYYPGKSAKQLRDRYQLIKETASLRHGTTTSTCQINSKNNIFRKQEDYDLLEKYETYQNQWDQISDFFPNKTKNALKERHFFLRKQYFYSKGESSQNVSSRGTMQNQQRDDSLVMHSAFEKPEVSISDYSNMKKPLFNSQIVNPELFNKFRKTVYSVQESQNDTFETGTQTSRIEQTAQFEDVSYNPNINSIKMSAKQNQTKPDLSDSHQQEQWQVPAVPHAYIAQDEYEDAYPVRVINDFETSSQNQSVKMTNNEFKRPKTQNQNKSIRQLDEASDYMSDPINKSMEQVPLDPEIQYQHQKYAKRINKELQLQYESRKTISGYKSVNSDPFIKQKSYGTQSSNQRERLFSNKLIQQNHLKFGSSLNSKSCLMQNRDSLRSVKMSVQSAGQMGSNMSTTFIQKIDEDMQSITESFKQMSIKDKQMDEASMKSN